MRLTASHVDRQIACADVVLLNKADLASAEQIRTLEAHIRSINTNAIVHKTIRGEIDLKHIIGIEAYAMRAISMTPLSDPATPHEHEHVHADGEACDHDHDAQPHHYEIRGITSLQVRCPTLSAAGLQALDEWVREVLWESRLPGQATRDDDLMVLRCKGMFHTADGKVHVLQGVRNMYEIAPVEKGGEELGVPDEGKVVFIGKGLDASVRRKLEEIIQSHSA